MKTRRITATDQLPTASAAGLARRAAMMRSTTRAIEWPTWLLIFTIYSAWLALVLGYRSMPAWIANPVLVLVVAWHMSLQHELLHGHPTRNKAFNRLLGLFPMSAWYPYDIYRDSHLTHHRDEFLTTPGVDPECNYLQAHEFERLWKIQRAMRWFLRTALGRLLLGPALTIPLVWADIVSGPLKRDFTYVRTWVVHLSLLIAMLWWVSDRSGITPLHYLFGIDNRCHGFHR